MGNILPYLAYLFTVYALQKIQKKKNQKTEGKTLTERPRVVNINA